MGVRVHCSILKISVKEQKSLTINGGVAQLGEHLPCKQGVRSSILLISTIGRNGRNTAEGSDPGNGRIAQVVRAHA